MIDYNKTVLVVDDFATMRRIIKTCLKDLGFSNFVEAEDGKRGYDLAVSLKDELTLIVSDWNMPNMDGLDMLMLLKATNSVKHIPVMMVTAEAKKENIIAAAKAGAASYIVKPFTPDTMREKLEKLQKRLSENNQ